VQLFILGLFFLAIERINPAEKDRPYFKDDFWQEIWLAVFNALIAIPIFLFAVGSLLTFVITPLIPYQAFDETLTRLPLLAQVLLAAFIMDFSTYWRHRFTHRYFWNAHSIHHSAEHIGWATSLRLHPLDVLIAILFDLSILYFLGFSGAGMAFAALIITGFNYFTHSNINIKFGKPIRYIFASPHYHRWHHALESEAHGKNFCSMFSLLDIMFGSFYHPETLPRGYGIGEDQKDYPKTFIGQLAYPFRRKKNKTDKSL